MRRAFRLLGINALVLLGLIAAVELICFLVLLREPPRESWQRTLRWDLSGTREPAERHPSPYRIQATLDRLPVISPAPPAPDGDPSRVDYSEMHPHDFWGGLWALRPDHTARHVVRLRDGQVIYDVTSRTDAFGRRISSPSANGGRRRHVLLFGCSFAFGNGIEDDQTLVSQLARNVPGVRAYNYGVPGSGPHEFLETIVSRDLRREVPEEEGLAIYLYIPDHLRRMPPTISSLASRFDSPYYYETDDGKIVRAPSFRAARPFAGFLYDLLSASQTLKYLKMDFPSEIGPARFRLAALLARKMADEYLRQFPKGEFAVLLYPSQPMKDAYTRHLDEVGVKYLDYSEARLETRMRELAHVSVHDWHPSAEANGVLARQIARDLGLAR